MTTDPQTQSLPEPNFGDRLALAFIRLARILLRLLFVVSIAAVLAFGLYLGVPRLYQDFIQPVQEHTAQIADLNVRQDEIAMSVEEGLSDFQDRVGNLEVQMEIEAEQVGELAARQEELEAALDMQAELDQRIAVIEDELAALAAVTDQNESALEALSEGLEANDTPFAALEREVQITRVLNLIARARLDIGQSNAGLAEQNIRTAQELLEAIRDTVPENELARITPALERLQLALANLEDTPIVAANDLDAAWNALVLGKSESEVIP